MSSDSVYYDWKPRSALFGPKRSKTGPDEESSAGKPPLRRRIDEAVRRRIFDLTVTEVKDRNARYDQREILDLIGEELNAARADHS